MAGDRRVDRRSPGVRASMLAPLLLGRDPDDLGALRRGAAGGGRQRGREGRGRRRAARPGRAAARRTAGAAARRHRRCGCRPTSRWPPGTPWTLADGGAARVADGFTRAEGQGRHRRRAATSPGSGRSAAAVGPEVRIRLDANQGWTPREAVRVIRGMEDAGLDVELVEQPVARWDLDGLAWVSDRVGVPILADEAVFGGPRPGRGDPPPGGRPGQRQAGQVRRPGRRPHAARTGRGARASARWSVR